MPHKFKKICLAGVGLIGGSMGLALKQREIAETVVGYDKDENTLALAADMEAVDKGTTSISEAVSGADIVVLCTPVEAFENLLKNMLPFLSPDTIITDTGSTKGDIVKKIEKLLPDGLYYVGGHPMSGSEKTGVEAADRYLFENAVYVLTPANKSSDASVESVSVMAEALGAQVVYLSPGDHDEVVAAVSHVPHITAAGLVLTLMEVAEDYPYAPDFAAGGFKDSTRIAAGDPELWKQICFSNQEKIIDILSCLRNHLYEMETSIREGRQDQLAELLGKAREQRLQIPSRSKGILPAIYEIVITVPDRPGIIGYVGTILGEKNVNVIDIEILRVREGEGGTIRLGFQSEEARRKAADILKENNILVRNL